MGQNTSFPTDLVVSGQRVQRDAGASPYSKGGALPHQPLAFTMRTACVFFLDGWNAERERWRKHADRRSRRP